MEVLLWLLNSYMYTMVHTIVSRQCNGTDVHSPCNVMTVQIAIILCLPPSTDNDNKCLL